MQGERFGRLVVMSEAARRGKQHFNVICDCGKEAVVSVTNLKSGHTKSCGCLHKEALTKPRTHGMSKTSEYKSYHKMLERCYNPNDINYKNYGGRGIVVCERWRESFENFFTDLGKKPTPKHSLERSKTDGNYEPSNCRWATRLEQNRNRRRHAWFEYNGIKLIREDWAKVFQVAPSQINLQIKRGKTFNQIFEYYNNKKQLAWTLVELNSGQAALAI